MIKKFKIEGPLLISNRVFVDDRGLFFESFNQKQFNEIVGENIEFVQDNVSVSQKNVVRGLHFQKPPFAQGKLVRVLKGKVIDVAVDIRKNSKTYGQHIAVQLSAKDASMLWIPKGFAHGFSVLENDTVFAYKCTNYYNNKSEDSILWNDSDLDIDWQVENALLSEKDENAQKFCKLATAF